MQKMVKNIDGNMHKVLCLAIPLEWIKDNHICSEESQK